MFCCTFLLEMISLSINSWFDKKFSYTHQMCWYLSHDKLLLYQYTTKYPNLILAPTHKHTKNKSFFCRYNKYFGQNIRQTPDLTGASVNTYSSSLYIITTMIRQNLTSNCSSESILQNPDEENYQWEHSSLILQNIVTSWDYLFYDIDHWYSLCILYFSCDQWYWWGENKWNDDDVLKCGKSVVSKVSYKLFCWCKTVKKIASLINNLSSCFLVQLPVSVLKQRNTQILISPQQWHTYLLTWFARNIYNNKKSFKISNESSNSWCTTYCHLPQSAGSRYYQSPNIDMSSFLIRSANHNWSSTDFSTLRILHKIIQENRGNDFISRVLNCLNI